MQCLPWSPVPMRYSCHPGCDGESSPGRTRRTPRRSSPEPGSRSATCQVMMLLSPQARKRACGCCLLCLVGALALWSAVPAVDADAAHVNLRAIHRLRRRLRLRLRLQLRLRRRLRQAAAPASLCAVRHRSSDTARLPTAPRVTAAPAPPSPPAPPSIAAREPVVGQRRYGVPAVAVGAAPPEDQKPAAARPQCSKTRR